VKLNPLTPAEKDVLFGRDRERQELVRIVTQDGFRAGLLYGEPGVGKTSLLLAGLEPALHERNDLFVYTNDTLHPVEALASGWAQHSSDAPQAGEAASAYLMRVAAAALPGKITLFVVDDADVILRDDKNVQSLGDLFSRLVVRSQGRVRFLFVAASGRIHRLSALEKRTGSLFPPSNRFELARFQPQVAEDVANAMVAVGMGPAEVLPAVVADRLAQGLILPADLAIAAMASKWLGVHSRAGLADRGGAAGLERAWLIALAAETGNERAALRLLGEIDHKDGLIPTTAEAAAARAGVDAGFAAAALPKLASLGLVQPAAATEEGGWVLVHEVLGPRIRELAAPSRAAVKRATGMLGEKAARNRALTFQEFMEVRREGIVPTDPKQKQVLVRTQRLGAIIAGAVVGVPLLIVLMLWMLSLGKAYFDVTAEMGQPRVVVRAGRPALTFAFGGGVIADTGLTRATVESEEAWKKLNEHDLTSGSDDYGDALATLRRKDLQALYEAAVKGDKPALQAAAERRVVLGKVPAAASSQSPREGFESLLVKNADAAILVGLRLVNDDAVSAEDRLAVLEALRLQGGEATAREEAIAEIQKARQNANKAIQAAALPLYARYLPDAAGGELAVMIGDAGGDKDMRVAVAHAWGELAKKKFPGADTALTDLLTGGSQEARAAAAEGYGYLGRASQEELAKVIKTAPSKVVEGAVRGLVRSLETGGNQSGAIGPLVSLWIKKGKPRRVAAEAFVEIAKTRPNPVAEYLASAARSEDDRQLRPIGVRGLCNAILADHKSSQKRLVAAARDESPEVRRLVMDCAKDRLPDGSTAASVAAVLAEDTDATIRADAADVLARSIAGESTPEPVNAALLKLMDDRVTDIRVVAIRGMARFGKQPPEGLNASLKAALDDPSPEVRAEALKTAVATGTAVASAIRAALTDNEVKLRRAALESLDREDLPLDQVSVLKALELAQNDSDPQIGALALDILARRAPVGEVTKQIGQQLAERSEATRVRAAQATASLVERDPKLVVDLLHPVLSDPSHDVRVAALGPLATAHAKTQQSAALIAAFKATEDNAVERLVFAGALFVAAQNAKDVVTLLTEVKEEGSPLVRNAAAMTLGLISAEADGIAILADFMP
jgi:hypothetical protein